MKKLAAEHHVGIETYLTSTEGIGGILRSTPQDFIVTEQPLPYTTDSSGSFAIAQVTSSNWETNHLIRELSKRLHISRKRIGFAGTKDKRAVTTQYMSFAQVPEDALNSLQLSDVTIQYCRQQEKPLRLGDLYGNDFLVIIRNLSPLVSSETIRKCSDILQHQGGFPNFFGIQRFGTIRPITHLVGKDIVKGDLKAAVMRYLTQVFPDENATITNVRKRLKISKDFGEAFTQFPKNCTFEKALAHYLHEQPDDYSGALEQLPKNLLTMFIYAYQSYLFNRILSTRLKQGMSLNTPQLGDIVFPCSKQGIEEKVIPVTKENIEKVNTQLQKRKAVITGILIGSQPIYAQGDMGEIEQHIIEQEHLNPQEFIIPELPYLSSSGTRRSILAPIENLTWSLDSDDLHPNHLALILEFFLPKGSYATCVLREFMKAEDLTVY